MALEGVVPAIESQWASRCWAYSSQYAASPAPWSSARALGAPDVTLYRDDPNAWAPSVANGTTEWIALGYTTPVYATAVQVRESYGNGAVTKIELRDHAAGTWHEVWSGVDATAPGAVADLAVTLSPTSYLVDGVRITLDMNHSSAWEEIDAVALEGSPALSAPLLGNQILSPQASTASEAVEKAGDPLPEAGEPGLGAGQAEAQILSGSGPDSLIFVDPAVAGYASLVHAAPSGSAVVVLDDGRDGIEQITEALAGRRNISAIYIVSHGAPGQVILGDASLTLSSLPRYADDLALWGQSLTPDGDILLYGCSVAAGDAGQDLIRRLAEITGGDVAASTNPTGSADWGGDWVLEEATGSIETASWLPGGAAPDFHGLLAPGDLDPTFGSGGIVTTNIGSSFGDGYGMALQPDGKIVVAGDALAYHDAYPDFIVVRYNSDGSLDSTFGSGGEVITPIGSSGATARSVAVQPDGRIVAAGYTSNSYGSDYDFAVVRYNSDGSLDSTFGSGGKVTTAVGSSHDYGYDVALQSDGKIVVAGYSYNGSNYDFAVVRYNSDGSLDTTFGSGGKVRTAMGSSTDRGYSVALQSDGKIVVAGNSSIGTSNDGFAVARYNSDGSLDTTFGSGGKVMTDVGPYGESGYSVALQSNGGIVVAGYAYNSNHDADFAVVRYSGNGSLDTTFGSGGKVTTAIGLSSDDYGYSVAVQPDGKIVVGGYTSNGSDYDMAVIRYNSAGSLDTTFGSGGKVTTAIGSSDDYGYRVVLQSNGKIVVAGSTCTSSYGNDSIAVVRYNSAGSLDTTFGSGGMVTTAVGLSSDYGYGVALQSDGRVVVAGYTKSRPSAADADFAVVRYNSDGSLDSTFGSGGKVTTSIATGDDNAYGVAIQSDGKIVVAGCSGGYNGAFAVVRYNGDGSLDSSFGSGGVVTTAMGLPYSGAGYCYAVAIQADGKIVVAGKATMMGYDYDFAVVRYNSDGSLDTTFGSGGKLTTDLGSLDEAGYSVAVQPDGKIVVGGYTSNGSDRDMAVIRYNSDGSLDTTFGSGGKVTTAIGLSDDYGYSVALQPDGKIVVGRVHLERQRL